MECKEAASDLQLVTSSALQDQAVRSLPSTKAPTGVGQAVSLRRRRELSLHALPSEWRDEFKSKLGLSKVAWDRPVDSSHSP